MIPAWYHHKTVRRLLLAWLLGLLLASSLVASAQEKPLVLLLQIEGPVTPAMHNYFQRGIRTAEREGASAVLIVLNTPGGQVDITLDIVESFRRSPVPVIVFIGPAGAQAASAGSIITAAAHASGMAPETVIGLASPIQGSGEDIGDTLFRKLTEDLKATMRSLLERRGPAAVSLGESMIDEAVAVTADEALSAGFIDAIAASPEELLADLDGKIVPVAGTPVTLHLAGANRRSLPLNTIEAALHALANPTIVAIFFALAVPAILIELQSPGGWVAGFVGVVSLILGFYGAGQLPVNWLGLALIVVAFILLLMEAFVPSFGGLAITGSVTLVAGLLIFFNSRSTPEFGRLSPFTAIGISLPIAGIFLAIATLAVKAQRQKPKTGREGLVGRIGQARQPLNPAGIILVEGELWQAYADEPVPAGEKVVVERVEGLKLKVKPLAAEHGGSDDSKP